MLDAQRVSPDSSSLGVLFGILSWFVCAPCGAWELMDSPTRAELQGVWGSSSQDVYAVGYDYNNAQGVLLHFDGSSWKQIEGAGDNCLLALWGSGPGSFHAVGYRPYDVAAVHFADGLLQRSFPGREVIFLFGVWGWGPSQLFASGYTQGGGRTILRADGRHWTLEKLPGRHHHVLRGIWGSGPSDVTAVGTRGAILHFDGESWSEMPSGVEETLQGVHGSGPENIWAVGERGTILRYDGKSWSRAESGTSAFLSSVWCRSEKEAYAVGQGGTLLRHKGRWQPAHLPTKRFLRSVFGFPSGELFAVGSKGTILRHLPGQSAGLDETASPPSDAEENVSTREVIVFEEQVLPQVAGDLEAEVNFPDGNWAKAELEASFLALNDAWDRLYSLSVELPGGEIEIDRGATDWGYGLHYRRDVSRLASLFRGRKKFRLRMGALQSGWRVDVKIFLTAGAEENEEADFLPLWHRETLQYDPTKNPPLDARRLAKNVTVERDAARAEIVLYATGHSPTGTNQEEFGPPRRIHVKVDGKEIARLEPWREDCVKTGCHGTTYPRSGWCPRDKVDPFHVLLPGGLSKGAHGLSVEMPDIERYWNLSACLVLWPEK